jgi:hypothetical protein
MPNALQMAGATAEPSNFAPLHTNRIFTGLWTNRSPLRDAATSDYQEHYGMGRQDSIWTGFNSEISPRLTLKRRAGSSIYSPNAIPPIKRFYSFNSFTLTDEVIRVMADTATTVYDYTVVNPADPDPARVLFNKSPGAGSTYFLGVGNTLYFTNGVDNKQAIYDPEADSWTAPVDWGLDAPTDAPVATQAPRSSPYPPWAASTVYAGWVPRPDVPTVFWNYVVVRGSDGNLHKWGHFALITDAPMNGQLGAAEPPWPSSSADGTINWTNAGAGAWQLGFGYGAGDLVVGHIANPPGTPDQLFLAVHGGQANAVQEPNWGAAAKIGMQISDGANGLVWQNVGRVLAWSDIATLAGSGTGLSNYITTQATILDPNGYLETIFQMGTSAASPPSQFQQELFALTGDGTLVIWQNTAAYSVPSTAPVIYGYEIMDSATEDLSNMSPPSNPITVIQGNQVTVQGYGSAQGDTIVLFRTAQGGSTFFMLATFPNPGAGVKWTYIDNTPDSGLNTEWQAQVSGEGTPLPAGATCLGYHVGRVFAGVGNVVWISSGPDATVGGSSGNAGFDIQLVAQSKIIRFWACSLGMVVFTVRDAYIILGSGTDADPLYMVIFIEDLPLKSYDCFTINKTTPFLFLGNNQLVSLDPSAGIIEVGFPIADRLIDEYDPAKSYLTFHSQSTLDTALYIANGNGQWYRMAANNAPEQGSAWSTKAVMANFTAGCVQSVEVYPGSYRLLIAPTTAGAVLQRDRTKNTDNGNAFAAQTVFGNIVLAEPGQLAALSFITLESILTGTRPGLALLLGEISGTFDQLNRTRQDPPILPPSNTLYSDRYHFAQNQNEAWCRHFQMEITWPAEDAANELLTYTIFGQTWQEMRSQ